MEGLEISPFILYESLFMMCKGRCNTISMSTNESKSFIGCGKIINLKCKIGNDLFTQGKEYIAESKNSYEGSECLFTDYSVIADDGNKHPLTVDMVIKNFNIC